MKRNRKKLLLVGIIVLIIIAGLLDLKYEGLLYQMLFGNVRPVMADILIG